jgi:hypothetical protein
MTKCKCRRCGRDFEAADPETDALCDDCAWETWYDAELERSREFDEEVA